MGKSDNLDFVRNENDFDHDNLNGRMRSFFSSFYSKFKRMLLMIPAIDKRKTGEQIRKYMNLRELTVEALLERADGNYPNGGKKEGIVIRPTEPVYCELISAALSMKVVSNRYLLKNE